MTTHLVRCERHGGQHPLEAACLWPHLVAPPAAPPRPVGHPLTPHD